MIRIVVAALGCGVLLLSACATTRSASVGITRTTSGEQNSQCVFEYGSCARSDDCCSLWCLNGECALMSP